MDDNKAIIERIASTFFGRWADTDLPAVRKYIASRMETPEGRERLAADMKERREEIQRRQEYARSVTEKGIEAVEKELDRITEEYIAAIKQFK